MIKKIIIGKIKTLAGLHIGSGEQIEVTASPIYRSVNGTVIIPGTTIAGSLRTLATRIAPHLGFDKCIALVKETSTEVCSCPICNLFGSINPAKGSNKGTASKLWIYDAVLEEDSRTSIRDGVGISRETGASSRLSRAKYDLEVVPKDSIFSFKIAFEDNVDEELENILACALAEWKEGRGFLGGNISRGLGNIQLIEFKLFSLDLSKTDNLMRFLKEDDPVKIADEEANWLDNQIEDARRRLTPVQRGDRAYLYNSFVQLYLTIKFDGGFVINDILKSIQCGYDFCPKMENGIFILPGSSLRGAIRSHAEKIARSLATLHAQDSGDFLTKCPACNPFADKGVPLTSCNVLWSKYKRKHKNEEFEDDKFCLACQVFGSSYKGSRLYISDGYLSNPSEIKIIDFLALDRFTGGGKEGAKFDALVLWRPSFKLHIFLENPKGWELGWLMLVLKDLKDGMVPIGFGKSKWFGKATTENETIKIGAISEDFILKGLLANFSHEGIFKTKTLSIDDIKDTLETWISEFHKVLLNFKRKNGFISGSDTYFKDYIAELYPKKVEL